MFEGFMCFSCSFFSVQQNTENQRAFFQKKKTKKKFKETTKKEVRVRLSNSKFTTFVQNPSSFLQETCWCWSVVEEKKKKEESLQKKSSQEGTLIGKSWRPKPENQMSTTNFPLFGKVTGRNKGGRKRK
jgi:hypothetical protein